MLVDTHCHLSSDKFQADRDVVIERAQDAGVSKIISPSVDLKDAKRIINICKDNKNIWGLAGVYPGKIRSGEIVDEEVGKLKEFVEKNKKYIVGIGEIGLDNYWMGKQPELERELFRTQMELAVKMDMPVVIHQRETEDEIRKIMDQMENLPKGQFHCWSGSDTFLEYVLERGFYVGFCGNVTYKNNHKLREQAKRVPSNRLLLETDSPYLPPIGKRGERNEPINVKIMASVIAETRGVSVEELVKQTTNNVNKLFGI